MDCFDLIFRSCFLALFQRAFPASGPAKQRFASFLQNIQEIQMVVAEEESAKSPKIGICIVPWRQNLPVDARKLCQMPEILPTVRLAKLETIRFLRLRPLLQVSL